MLLSGHSHRSVKRTRTIGSSAGLIALLFTAASCSPASETPAGGGPGDKGGSSGSQTGGRGGSAGGTAGRGGSGTGGSGASTGGTGGAGTGGSGASTGGSGASTGGAGASTGGSGGSGSSTGGSGGSSASPDAKGGTPDTNGTPPPPTAACSTMPAMNPPPLKKTLFANIPGAQPGQVLGVPGEPNLLYVVGHKNGKIYIIQDGKVLATQLAEVSVAVNANDEQGLLGMALHPDFVNNKLFYLFYTGSSGGAMVIDEFERMTPTTSMKKSTIWNKPRTGGGTYHNGGSIYFNPKDGGKPLLYHAVGNNLSNDASNPTGVSGRILVHDLAAKTATTVSYGFRNPYRMSIDRLTGDMWIGEVSQSQGGAIFFNPFGNPVKNFGFTTNGSEIKAGMSISGQDGSSGAIIGGVVYRGSKIPGLCGRYFYGMWRSGVIKSFIQEGGKKVGATFTHPGDLTVPSVTSFGEDNDGEIYMSAQGGNIFKLEAAGAQ